MDRRDVWKRLLWKEVREDRWPLGIALVSMTALYALASAYPTYGSSVGQLLAILASGSVHLALAIWGATRGDSGRSVKEFEFTHLPTSPMLNWGVAIGIPTLASAVLGLWYGFMAQEATSREGLIPLPLIGALDLALTYAVCYFMASLVSLWAGILIGMAQLMGGTLIPVWQSEMPTDAYTLIFAGRTLAAGLTGALILAMLRRTASPAAQKGAALGAAVLILYGPMIVQGLPELLHSTPRVVEPEPRFSASTYQSPDGAVVVAADLNVPRAELEAGRTGIMVVDNARNIIGRTVFLHQDIEIIGALRDGRAFLAQQRPGSRTVSIIEWDYVHNRTSTRARLTTGTKALTDRSEGYGGVFLAFHGMEHGLYAREISPDGRYVILGLGALIGSTADIWVMDLERGRSKVALLAIPEVVSTVWKSDHVLLGTENGAFRINLRTFECARFRIPDMREARR